jgi:nucleotidyltransferase AbiEii toxin of type IV toxin-antitoxin system
MSLGAQIATLRERGFTAEQAEVITLMTVTAGVLFQDFPNSFVLFGGATLLLFHQSLRHSGDLDLLSITDEPPKSEAIQASLANGIRPAAAALNLGPLQFENVSIGNLDPKLWVKSRNGRYLFRVDLNRFGSVLESEVEEHVVAIDDETLAKVKSVSLDFQLLQKAECFLLRKVLKTRDGYDIHLLKKLGAVLDNNLKNHLADTLTSYEIEAEDIKDRIGHVDEKRCGHELRSVLPPDVFESLAKESFRPLRDALHELYAEWV